MKIFFIWLFLISMSFAGDATIEVIKKVDTLPSLAVEDATVKYDNAIKMLFFKSLVADLNVISIFNVDGHYRNVDFGASNVVVENKDMKYVLRYRIFEDDSAAFNVEMKLLKDNSEVLSKSYKANKNEFYMFISHAIAFDVNEYMGEPSVEWMKRKVVFSKNTTPKKTEIVISDYTLTYQHTIVAGGFNIFPKWANKEQTSLYFTSLDSKPTLKQLDIKTGQTKAILSSDGMMICSDVSTDSKKILVTMAPNGQPDVYMYNVDTKKSTKITNYSGIDVGGQFLDDNTVVFVSNRLGYPNIFSQKINTGVVEQMIFYGKSNAACSVNGEYIVYKARESSDAFGNNTFNLHLISTKTDFIRRLTASGVNEFPRFSKDGDAILFIKNYMSQSSIGIIRLNHDKNYLFPLKQGKIQSMDW
ncbi:MAG: Tol-Pal system protein TolB [Sulfurimonas sp.]